VIPFLAVSDARWEHVDDIRDLSRMLWDLGVSWRHFLGARILRWGRDRDRLQFLNGVQVNLNPSFY
jgi:hypothetical protein